MQGRFSLGKGGRIIDPDYGDITHLVAEVLKDDIRIKEELARRRQRRIQESGIMRVRNGKRLAAPSMRVDSATYWHWYHRENLLNNRYSKEKINPWADKGFRNDLARDNPELRTVVEKNMETVSFAGSGASDLIYTGVSGNKRFSKSYG